MSPRSKISCASLLCLGLIAWASWRDPLESLDTTDSGIPAELPLFLRRDEWPIRYRWDPTEALRYDIESEIFIRGHPGNPTPQMILRTKAQVLFQTNEALSAAPFRWVAATLRVRKMECRGFRRNRDLWLDFDSDRSATPEIGGRWPYDLGPLCGPPIPMHVDAGGHIFGAEINEFFPLRYLIPCWPVRTYEEDQDPLPEEYWGDREMRWTRVAWLTSPRGSHLKWTLTPERIDNRRWLLLRLGLPVIEETFQNWFARSQGHGSGSMRFDLKSGRMIHLRLEWRENHRERGESRMVLRMTYRGAAPRS